MKHYLTTLLSAIMIAGTLPCSGEVQRPEHPRPDQFRENWMTLNGEWQFEIDDKADGETRGLPHGKDLGDRIIVPFCLESKPSGLGYGNTTFASTGYIGLAVASASDPTLSTCGSATSA